MVGQGTGPATVTLADVARRARVSPATASRVINGSAKRVTNELKERVLRAVQDLRYVPNAHAQHLARAQRLAAGVIVHDVSDPYFAEITRGLQRVASERGRLLVICNSYGEPERELAYVELLRAQQVHAIVLAGSGYHDAGFTRKINNQLEAYTRSGGRVSVIGRHDYVGGAVTPDNEHGGYLAGTHLYKLGHTRIGVIAGPKTLTTITDRIAGIRRAAREHGRGSATQRLAYTDVSREGGAVAAGNLVDTYPGMTAIIALTDSMAVGAYATLRRRGIRVADQLSVVGFDDIPIAVDVTPPLTTVRLPLVEMGTRAMTLALDEDEPPDRREAVAVELIERESCAPPSAPLPPARLR